MLSITDLKNGIIVIIDGEPFQIMEVSHQHIGRGGSSIQTKIKNLITGQVLSRNFKPSDTFGEADIEKRKLKFLYSHRTEHIFVDSGNQKNRRVIPDEIVKNIIGWLKPNTECEAVFLDERLISLSLPIKVELKVTESPPGVKGDRAQSGTKSVTLETGAVINVPLFINEGDVIRINTQTGEYTERVEKA